MRVSKNDPDTIVRVVTVEIHSVSTPSEELPIARVYDEVETGCTLPQSEFLFHFPDGSVCSADLRRLITSVNRRINVDVRDSGCSWDPLYNQLLS